MSHDLLKLPEPFLDADAAGRLANLIASFPVPERVGDEPPSEDFAEGFREALRVACMLTIAVGSESGSPSGCAPVASR